MPSFRLLGRIMGSKRSRRKTGKGRKQMNTSWKVLYDVPGNQKWWCYAPPGHKPVRRVDQTPLLDTEIQPLRGQVAYFHDECLISEESCCLPLLCQPTGREHLKPSRTVSAPSWLPECILEALKSRIDGHLFEQGPTCGKWTVSLRFP